LSDVADPKVQNKGSFDFDPWYAERLYGRLHAAGRKALLLYIA